MKPIVTVIIPYYNQGVFLERAILSALNSYDGPLQVIVIDDGSTEVGADAHLRRASQLSNSVEVVRKENGGLSSARNAGLAVAKGEYIQFLDCDDMLLSSKIGTQVGELQNANIDISICNYVACDEVQAEIYIEGYDPIGAFPLTIETFLNKWERGFVVPIHCGLFSKSIIGSLRFDEGVHGKEDWIFWCNLIGRGARPSYIPIFGAIYRKHSASMTAANIDKMRSSWLLAVNKISSQVEAARGDFIENSLSWYNMYYRDLKDERRNAALEDFNIQRRNKKHEDEEGEIISRLRSMGEAEMVKISVIIPLFNHYEYFLRCLLSVLQQDVGQVEVVIVDDGSRQAELAAFLDTLVQVESPLRLIRLEANSGISSAQNTAAQVARGEFLAFVDCDDMLEGGAVEAVLEHLESNPGIDYLFTDRVDIDEEDRELRLARFGGYPWIAPSGVFKHDLIDGMVASHLKVVRRSTYLDMGGCDSSVDGVQDWDLALKVLRAGGEFSYLALPLYRHRIHRRSVTRSDSTRQLRLTNVIRRKYAWRILSGEESQCARGAPRISPGNFKEWVDDDRIAVIGTGTLPKNGSDIRRLLGDRKVSVFFEDGPADFETIATLKEWNSYFDLIVVSSLKSYISLIGYLWDQAICVFFDDFDATSGATLRLLAAGFDPPAARRDAGFALGNISTALR